MNLWPTECHAAKIENNCDPSCNCHYSANAFRNTLLLQKDKLVDLLEDRGKHDTVGTGSKISSKVRGLNQWTSPSTILSRHVFKILTVEIDIRVGRPCCWTRECHHRIPHCSPSPKLSSYPWGDHQSSGQHWPHGQGRDRSHQRLLLGCPSSGHDKANTWAHAMLTMNPPLLIPCSPFSYNIQKPRRRGGGLGKRQGDKITRCAKSLRPVIALAVSNATSRKWITHDLWIIWLQISSIFFSSFSSTGFPWEKSNRSLSSVTNEPFWSTFSPNTCRNA